MRTLLITVLALAAAGGVQAQSAYPNRAITMIVGFAPGGGTDAVARILAKSLGDSLDRASFQRLCLVFESSHRRRRSPL